MTLPRGQYPLPEKFAYLNEVVAMDGIFDHKSEPSEFAQALDLYLMTLSYFGGGAWSDETLAQALAWGWMAGFTEASVLSGIRIPILVASYRFAIRGGCVPRFDLMQELLSPKLRDLYSFGAKTPWLPALMERYSITHWETINYREWNPDILKLPWVGVAAVPTTARSRSRNDFEPLITARSRTRQP
jgi:hypothetical protein